MKQKHITRSILVAIPLCLLIIAIALVVKHGPRVQDAPSGPPSEPLKCWLPAVTTGYDVSKCPATSGAHITASDCIVACAPGYTGSSPAAACDNAGTAFVLSGCTRGPAPPPPKPPPSPARPECHTNLITQLAPDGKGLPACRATNTCTQDPLTCQSYGIPLRSCMEQTTQATCEEEGGGGPHPLDPSRPKGQCKWDTAKGSCGPNFTYMQNVCDNSVQVTQIEDECKGLNQSQCTSPARNNCEWRSADKTCRYKIDKEGQTRVRSVTQFENCKWVGDNMKKGGSSMCVPQSFADGVNEAVACTPGDWGSGDKGSVPAKRDFINGNFNSANGHIEACECSGHS